MLRFLFLIFQPNTIDIENPSIIVGKKHVSSTISVPLKNKKITNKVVTNVTIEANVKSFCTTFSPPKEPLQNKVNFLNFVSYSTILLRLFNKNIRTILLNLAYYTN
jgi:hypothetical protein